MNIALWRSELIKLGTLRSTYLLIGVAVAAGLGIGVLEMTATAQHWSQLTPTDRSAFDPVADSFTGFQFTQLAFGAFGVLSITAETATGTIRPTLLASPRRLRLYSHKVAALLSVALPTCMLSAFAAFLLGQQSVRSRHLDASLTDPHVLRAVLAAGIFMTVITLVGFGLGALIRHTAGALVVMVGLVFLAWPLARALESFSYLPDRLLLVNAADALVEIHPATGPSAQRTPSIALAGAVLAAYVIVLIAAGAWRATRDQ